MTTGILRAAIVAICFCSAVTAAQQSAPALATTAGPFRVVIRVDASRPSGELKPIYWFFGADEPNDATMKDGWKLLGELGTLGEPQTYFRAHSLLVTGDGTPALKWGSTNIYTVDAQGRAVYDWTIVDHIFETYLARGVKPYAQIGFMPQALSVRPEPYQHAWRPGLPYDDVDTGWAYPPKDYAKWGELVYQWVTHCVEKCGRAEGERWYWEVWNEPNIGYWRGTPAELFKLHDYAVAAVRRALPTARVGGPDVAGSGGTFMYSSSTAAAFARKHLHAEKHGVNLTGALTWAFEFEDQPYCAGFRALATNGIDLPVLNVFRMMAKLTGQRVLVESTGDLGVEAIMRDGVRVAPDVASLASLAPGRRAVLVWHYHDDAVPGPDAGVQRTVAGLPLTAGAARLTHYRIDDSHSNAYAEWKRLGSPIAPTRQQYAQLEAAGRLGRLDAPTTTRVERGTAAFAVALPRQAVSLLLLEWPYPR